MGSIAFDGVLKPKEGTRTLQEQFTNHFVELKDRDDPDTSQLFYFEDLELWPEVVTEEQLDTMFDEIWRHPATGKWSDGALAVPFRPRKKVAETLETRRMWMWTSVVQSRSQWSHPDAIKQYLQEGLRGVGTEIRSFNQVEVTEPVVDLVEVGDKPWMTNDRRFATEQEAHAYAVTQVKKGRSGEQHIVKIASVLKGEPSKTWFEVEVAVPTFEFEDYTHWSIHMRTPDY